VKSRGPRRPPASRDELAVYLGFIEDTARAVLRRRGLRRADFLPDATQDGFLGLSRAWERYEGERGTSFESYARPFVQGAVIDGLRRGRKGDPVQALLQGADATAADFAETQQDDGEGPATPLAGQTVARRGTEGFLAALGFGFLGAIRRLDPESALQAQEGYAAALDTLKPLVARLAQREQTVLQLRTVEGLSWEDVVEHLGRPKSTVQRWHAAALDQLRAGLATRGVTEMPPMPDREDDEEEEE
jgi:RNA polymerase sigma factor (sigma-70 family)